MTNPPSPPVRGHRGLSDRPGSRSFQPRLHDVKNIPPYSSMLSPQGPSCQPPRRRSRRDGQAFAQVPAAADAALGGTKDLGTGMSWGVSMAPVLGARGLARERWGRESEVSKCETEGYRRGWVPAAARSTGSGRIRPPRLNPFYTSSIFPRLRPHRVADPHDLCGFQTTGNHEGPYIPRTARKPNGQSREAVAGTVGNMGDGYWRLGQPVLSPEACSVPQSQHLPGLAAVGPDRPTTHTTAAATRRG